jgi:hypothetical protein
MNRKYGIRKDQLQALWLVIGLVLSFSTGVIMMSELWAGVVVESGYAERLSGGRLEWKTCK